MRCWTTTSTPSCRASRSSGALASRPSRRPSLGPSSRSKEPRLDFITMCMRGKKIGFEKVIKMVDDMVVALKKEQADDDTKRDYCNKQFDLSDDKKKALE